MATMRVRTPGDIAFVLQQARLEAGVSQADLAERLDLPQSTISQMENGQSTIFLRRLLEMMQELDIVAEFAWPTE